MMAQKPVSTIPEFTFYKSDKSPFTNTNLESGKMLFFVFFDVTCEHCQHAIQYINKHAGKFKNVAVYLITLDEWDKVKSFLDKYGPQLEDKTNITMLRDTRNEFIIKFGPVKYPSLFLFSTQRKLILYDDDEKSLESFMKKINPKVK
jgi:cytochrome oxidase Cu insertion factor (SCO1/SenC/PrrC family)